MLIYTHQTPQHAQWDQSWLSLENYKNLKAGLNIADFKLLSCLLSIKLGQKILIKPNYFLAEYDWNLAAMCLLRSHSTHPAGSYYDFMTYFYLFFSYVPFFFFFLNSHIFGRLIREYVLQFNREWYSRSRWQFPVYEQHWQFQVNWCRIEYKGDTHY